MASHEKPGIALGLSNIVITVELRVVTEVMVVSDVELVVETTEIEVLDVAVTVTPTVATFVVI